jgi:hypothetical protein
LNLHKIALTSPSRLQGSAGTSKKGFPKAVKLKTTPNPNIQNTKVNMIFATGLQQTLLFITLLRTGQPPG